MNQDLYSNISNEKILSELKLHYSKQRILEESLLKTYINILKDRGVLTDDLVPDLQKSIVNNDVKIPPSKRNEQPPAEERMVTFKEYNKLRKDVSSAGRSVIYACVWAFIAILSSLIGTGISMSGELSPREIPDILMTTTVISGIAILGFFISLFSAGVKFRDTIPQK